ncbi:hypothetical protein ACFYPC_05920 [Streptomyces sp. NPDC005808]|uniref:hypothetical protein n=1 Tax=Streptomyces sp. NPDC005808 TaxID=3364734 RepID=UPI0036BF2BBC
MTGPTGEIYRVDWLPGTDILHGTCHCGAEHTAQDPIQMWEWMLAHPDGHEPPALHPHDHRPPVPRPDDAQPPVPRPEGHQRPVRKAQSRKPEGHAR